LCKILLHLEAKNHTYYIALQSSCRDVPDSPIRYPRKNVYSKAA
jgi:hypothetical protein